MKKQDHLPLAALLHDIGKFRQRATGRYTKHQKHSYEFVNDDFKDFFSPCGETFKNAILNHHTNGHNLTEKQVILADRLSATEREDEERETEDFVASPLASIMSRLKCADKEHRYKLTALNFDQDTIIPKETVDVNQTIYEKLWNDFTAEFRKATEDKSYEPAHYQTIVALLHKYTTRMPAATSWGDKDEKTVPDISLYDHLRTTAAIAACIGREFTTDTEVDEELKLLSDKKESDRKICALIKGDISGIQNFLYHIQSDGASNQLRGRSFYLQLLTEAIAHWVLKQFDLPITNLILASGGHFYILAPYSNTKDKLCKIRKQISEKLWELHTNELYCILDYADVKVNDFTTQKFDNKWGEVSDNVNKLKLKKWSELEAEQMFDNLFEPRDDSPIDEQENDEEKRRDPWQFEKLGRKLRGATTLVVYDVQESSIPDKPKWHDAIKAFGLDVDVWENTPAKPERQAENAVVYRLGDTRFLTEEKYQWEAIPMSYDFRIFKPVIAHQPIITHRHDTDDTEKIADYDYLANASQGVNWLGALRMDVDDLGSVFKDKLENATISRHATLSRELRLFFEGYVPKLCKEYNQNRDREILELIYAGGDDLFLVGGWSALPDIAEQIRSEFKHFVTGNHVTLSGGIAIEHKKYPLYQFAERSGEAERTAKGRDEKNAITFLQLPMQWREFADVREWHEKFLEILTGQDQLPRDILTRLSEICKDKKRWAWRSLYYFHRLQERYKYNKQKDFLRELKQQLNHEDSSQFREELIHVITRWTTLRIRNR